MRNLKKLLAVLTVVALMATLFVMPAAAAPSDVAGTAYESAVTRLNALGIITGREDGKFYPNDTITRAEFAAVVVRALGYGDAATAAKGQTKFSDVASDFWASGYVNLASSLGIIKGRPDGTFGANDKVLYEEAVTMIVRALGYEPAAVAKGGYPTGYLVIAAEEDVLDDAQGLTGTPASRGLVAQMTDNALEVALMIQTGYGTEVKFVKSGTEGTTKKTILDDKLKLDVREAVVSSVDVNDGEIKVKMTQDAVNGTEKGAVKTYSVFAGISIVGLENATVTLWKKDGVVYNIESDTAVLYDFITKVDGEDNLTILDYALEEINDLDLKNNGAGFDVVEDDNGDADFKLYMDGSTSLTSMTTADSAQTLIGKFAKIYIADGKVTRIEAYTMADADVGLITKVEANTLTITRGKDENKKITKLNDADSMTVIIDGTAKTYNDLEEDMVLQYKIIDGDKYVFVASTKTLSGTLESAKSGKVKIDGTSTDLAGLKWFSTDNGDGYEAMTVDADLKDMLGTDVFAYVSYRGKIIYLKGDVEGTTDFYGIIAKVSDFNEQIKVTRAVGNELKTVTYDSDLPSSVSGDYKTFAQVSANYALHDDPTAADRIALLYKFSINADGEITKAKLITTDPLTDVTFNKDSDFISDGTTRVYTDDATFFQVDGADIKLLKWTDIEGSSLPTPTSGLNIEYNTGDVTPAVILVNDTHTGIGLDVKIAFTTSDIFIGYVKDLSLGTDDDYTVVMVTPSGEEKTFLVDDGDLNGAAEKKLILYRLASDDYAKVDVVSGTYDALGITATNYVSVSDRFVASNGVDGSTLKIRNVGNTADDATVYALASDAVVYSYNPIRNAYTLSDITEVDEDSDGGTSKVSFVTYKGKIKFLYFWE